MADMEQSFKDILGHIERDVDELREGRKHIFERLDKIKEDVEKKVDRTDVSSINESVDRVSASIDKMVWKLVIWGFAGISSVCGFFWYRTEQIFDQIERQQTEIQQYKIATLETISALDKRTSLIEQQLRNLKLVD